MNANLSQGRSDKKSIRNILEKVDPKCLVLVHATKDATDNMKKFITEKDVVQADKIHTPSPGETVDVSSHLAMYPATLKNHSYAIDANAQSLGDYTIAFFDVEVKMTCSLC